MIYVSALESVLKGEWRVSALRVSLYARAMEALRGAKGSEWASRIKGDFLESLKGAVLVFESPWGFIYLDEYEPGWKVSAHGVFWGRGVVKGASGLKDLAKSLFLASDLKRIEVPVLGPARGLGRVLEGAGFTREGVLREGGRDASGFIVDKTIWSILKGEVE